MATKASSAVVGSIVDLLITVHVHLERYGDPADLDERIMTTLDLIPEEVGEATAEEVEAMRKILREVAEDEGDLLPVPLDSSTYKAIAQVLR